MNELCAGLWERAIDALKVAKHNLSVSSDAAANRAYYAAFYGVSAYFALQNKTFRKHSAVETAVHRDLVKAGIWTKKLGESYSILAELRTIGDYGDMEHVSPKEAAEAVKIAGEILEAVSHTNPEAFKGLDQ